MILLFSKNARHSYLEKASESSSCISERASNTPFRQAWTISGNESIFSTDKAFRGMKKLKMGTLHG